MASANFTVNGLAVPPELAVAASSLVTLSLLSASGADVIAWSIIGNHSHLAVNPTITPAGTPLGKTATFTMPAGASQAYLIQCQINGGVDSEGVEQSSYTKTALVGVVNPRGVVPFAFGENFERSATHGTTESLNDISEGGLGSGDVVGPAGATSGHLPSFSSGTGKALQDSGIVAADVVKRTGAVAMTGDLDLGTHKAINAADAVASTGLTTLQQTNALIAAGVAGAGGGGGDGFAFTFSATTADADPGAGTLRINNATPGAGMTQIFIDLLDTSSNDITAWLDRLDDSIGAVKGYIRVGSKSDKTKWLLFSLASVTSATGYRKLGVTYVAGPALPLTTTGDCFLSFESMGLIGLITNALIDPAAAIAWSKLATAIGNLGFTGLKTLSYNGEIDNATSTIDFTTGSYQKKTLAANTTLATPTPPPALTSVQMRFIQAHSGGPYTLAFWAGIIWFGPVPTMPTAADAELFVSGYYDGTNWRLGTGKPSVAGGVEYDASGNLQVSSQLPARGSENVVIDLFPNTERRGTLASGASVDFDYPIATGKRYQITADIYVDDGTGTGACLYTKALFVKAHQTGGVAVQIDRVVVSSPLESAGFTFDSLPNSTNIRFTLSNTSGTTRSYNFIAGDWHCDKP